MNRTHRLDWIVCIAAGIVALTLAVDASSAGESIGNMDAGGYSTRSIVATTPLVAALCVLVAIALSQDLRASAMPLALGLILVAGASEAWFLARDVRVVDTGPMWLYGAWLLMAGATASFLWLRLRRPSLLRIALGTLVTGISVAPPLETRLSMVVLLPLRIAACALIVWGLLSLRQRVMNAWCDEDTSD